MYLRCCHCHESTWIRSLVPGMVEATVACSDCGREHDLSRADELGTTGKEQYEKANGFAADNGVDLPTAYSVLLGLITLQQARGVDTVEKEKQRQESVEARTPEPQAKVIPERRSNQRRQPGSGRRRSDHGARSRHPVTIHVERDMAEERARLTLSQGILIAILAILVIGLSGRHAYLTWANLVEEGHDAQRNTAASAKTVANAKQRSLSEAIEKRPEKPAALQAQVKLDSEGRVLQVIGPNPQTVLEAYCKAASGTFLREPLGFSRAGAANERLGVFRDLARLETDFLVRIKKDRKTQRWIAGDGNQPILTRAAPRNTEVIRSATLTAPR